MQSFLNERRFETQEPLAAHTKERATLGENQGFDNRSQSMQWNGFKSNQ